MHDPMRVEEGTSGKVSKLIFFNLSNVSKFNVSGLKSETCCDISLIFPFLSNAAGFSLPNDPTLICP